MVSLGPRCSRQSAKRTAQTQVGVETSGAVPFLLRDGYLIVVEGRIGAQGHLKLVLDTGATHSVLRPDWQKSRRLCGGQYALSISIMCSQQELAEVPDFELGPIRIPLLPVMLNDLSYLRESVPGSMDLSVWTCCRGEASALILAAGISLSDPPGPCGSARRWKSMKPIWRWNSMLNRSVRLLLDTGVSAILLYRDRLGNRLPELRVEQQIRGASLGGAASLEVVMLPCIQLNGTDLTRRAVLLRNSPSGLLSRIDGYLSLTALGARQLQLRLRKEHL